MILYAEHSFNATTFTARVITSTLSDLYSAVVGAIGALKGPLHGGANEAVMHIFDEIGTADNAAGWLDTALAEKRKIMGFGHRVYKNGDSRVPTMKTALDTLIVEYDRPDMAELYDALEDGDDLDARASCRTSTTRVAPPTTSSASTPRSSRRSSSRAASPAGRRTSWSSCRPTRSSARSARTSGRSSGRCRCAEDARELQSPLCGSTPSSPLCS